MKNYKKVRVIYDPYIFLYLKHGGISRYYAELISRTRTRADIQQTFSLIYTDNEVAANSGLSKIYFPLRKINFKGAYRIHNLLCQVQMRGFYRKIQKGGYDIYHPSYYDDKILEYLPSNKFLIVTVHDMIHEKFPNYFIGDETAQRKKQLLDRANLVITVSENTRQDVLSHYVDFDKNKVKVIPLSSSLNPNGNVKPKLKAIEKPYFLFVGDRARYKNFNTLLEAFKAAFDSQKNINLVCAGGGKFLAEEKLILRQLNLPERVTQTEFTDSELVWLYQNAIAFVFPSQYEGFGLPILEAFRCGCPVISSNGGSLPEIGINTALFYESNSSKELTESLKLIYKDKDLRMELVRKGVERSKAFSWDKTINLTIELYKSQLKFNV